MLNLPEEVQKIIVEYLDDDDRRAFRLTCAPFYKLIGTDPAVIVTPLLNRLKKVDRKVSVLPPEDATLNPKWCMHRFVKEFNRLSALQNEEILHFRNMTCPSPVLSDIFTRLKGLSYQGAAKLTELEERHEILEEINARLIDSSIDRNYPVDLNLHNLGLTRLPERMFSQHQALWANLLQIDCSNMDDYHFPNWNRLKELPASLAEHCPLLTFIKCTNNELGSLPASLANLPLQSIDCLHNYQNPDSIPSALKERLGDQWFNASLGLQKKKPTGLSNTVRKTSSALKNPETMFNHVQTFIASFLPRTWFSSKKFYCVCAPFDINTTKHFTSFTQAIERHARRYTSDSPFHGDIIFYPVDHHQEALNQAAQFARASRKHEAFVIELNVKQLLAKEAIKVVEGHTRSRILWEKANLTHWSITRMQTYPENQNHKQTRVASKPILTLKKLFAFFAPITLLLSALITLGASYLFGLSLGMAFATFMGTFAFMRGAQYLRHKLAVNSFFEFQPNITKTENDYVFNDIGPQTHSLKASFDQGKKAENSWIDYAKSAASQTYLPTKHGRAFQAGRQAQEMINQAAKKAKKPGA